MRGAGEAGAARLTQRRLQHAPDEYIERWMAEFHDGEDPDAVRDEGVRTFRRVLRGPW